MSEERRDTTMLLRRFVGPAIGICVVCAGMMFLLMGYLSNGGDRGFGLPVTAGGIAVGIVAVAALAYRTFGRYRCPQCGKRLPRIDDSERGEYRYRCDVCDVIWNTGISDDKSIH